MYIEFVCNLLLQSEASGEKERLGELESESEDREIWRRTGKGRKERRGGGWGGRERPTQKDEGGEGR